MSNEKIILNTINDAMFGSEFYNNKMLECLNLETKKIIDELDLISTNSKYTIIKKIEDFLMTNVTLRMKYFRFFDNGQDYIPIDELQYRTAYSALIKKNTTCYGYSEAARILLSLCNINCKTLLAKLPGEKYRIMHYTTIANLESENFIVDPERHLYCIHKNIDYSDYIKKVILAYPTDIWFKEKISNCGVGCLANDYLDESNIIDNIKIKVL